jgi:uncharacterized membrane protein YfcA
LILQYILMASISSAAESGRESIGSFWLLALFGVVGSFLGAQILHSLPLAGAALAALGWSMRFRDRIEAVVYRKWLKRAPAAIAILPIVQYFVDN